MLPFLVLKGVVGVGAVASVAVLSAAASLSDRARYRRVTMLSAKESFDHLRAIFPQVNERVLAGVLEYHSMDVQRAADYIATHLIPASPPPQQTLSNVVLEPAEDTAQHYQQQQQQFNHFGTPVEHYDQQAAYSDRPGTGSSYDLLQLGVESVMPEPAELPQWQTQGQSSAYQHATTSQYAPSTQYGYQYAGSSLPASSTTSLPPYVSTPVQSMSSASSQSASFVSDMNAFHTHMDASMEGKATKQAYSETDQSASFSASQVLQQLSLDTIDTMMNEAAAQKEALRRETHECHSKRNEVANAEEEAGAAMAAANAAEVARQPELSQLNRMAAELSEANEQLSAELRAEHAVLSAEAKELSARHKQAKARRDAAEKSLAELRGALEKRLQAAVTTRDAAVAARVATEAANEAMIQQAKASIEEAQQVGSRLSAESSRCSELREALVDRACALDAIWGEIAVLEEDVLLLKEQVESPEPLARSSMSQSLANLSRSDWIQTSELVQPLSASQTALPASSIEAALDAVLVPAVMQPRTPSPALQVTTGAPVTPVASQTSRTPSPPSSPASTAHIAPPAYTFSLRSNPESSTRAPHHAFPPAMRDDGYSGASSDEDTSLTAADDGWLAINPRSGSASYASAYSNA
eukprot:jgi/Chlat1/6350/Chrsp44S05909